MLGSPAVKGVTGRPIENDVDLPLLAERWIYGETTWPRCFGCITQFGKNGVDDNGTCRPHPKWNHARPIHCYRPTKFPAIAQ
jgi:hypothetical protein